MIRISGSYADFLQRTRPSQRKSTTDLRYKEGTIFASTTRTPSLITIAPMNCNLDFSAVYPISIPVLMSTAQEPMDLPDRFNWAEKEPGLTRPPIQGNCGCCWAIATTTAISDNFLTQGVTPINPNLSYTSLLSCYEDETNLQCGGANPAMALQWITKQGLPPQGDKTTTFQWCLGNPKCTNASSLTDMDTLNELIPKCSNSQDLRFFISDVSTPTFRLPPEDLTQLSGTELNSGKLAIQKFLFTKGPAVVGLQIYQNFLSGHFLCNGDNPDNIYLERIDYETCKAVDKDFPWEGSHAVVLVGWGTGQVAGHLLKEDKEKVDVPYWILRNSWGENWGIQGYFHLAMHPFNKVCQLEKTVFVEESVQDPRTKKQIQKKIPTGGVLFFDLQRFGHEPGGTKEGFVQTHGYTAVPAVMKNEEIISFFILSMILFLMLMTVLVLCCHSSSKKKKNHET